MRATKKLKNFRFINKNSLSELVWFTVLIVANGFANINQFSVRYLRLTTWLRL